MVLRFLRRVSCVSCAGTVAALVVFPIAVRAESTLLADLMNVSIRIAGVADRSPDSDVFSGVGFAASATSIDGPVASTTTSIPESMYFDGLAGALNLAIDTTNGRPRIDGIVLAPSEILRFSAGHNSPIRGMQGHIAIRLDF